MPRVGIGGAIVAAIEMPVKSSQGEIRVGTGGCRLDQSQFHASSRSKKNNRMDIQARANKGKCKFGKQTVLQHVMARPQTLLMLVMGVPLPLEHK